MTFAANCSRADIPLAGGFAVTCGGVFAMLDHAGGTSEEVAGGMSNTETRRVGEDPPEVRVVRILDDFLKRRERGEAVTREALLARHPDLADELREHLEVVEGLTPGGGEIEDLIAQGVLRRSPDSGCVAELGAYQILGFLGGGAMGVVLKAHEESLNRTVAVKILRPELAREATTVARFEREAKAAAALKHPNIVTVHAVGRERGVHYIAMEYVEGRSLAELIREGEAPFGSAQGRLRCEGGGSDEETERRRDEGDVAAGPRTGRADRQDAGPTDDAGPTRVIRASLPPETIRHIFRQLLSALDAAHAAGLIHRDVKSSNILLEQRSGTPDQGLEVAKAPARPTPSCLRASVPSCLPTVKLADFGLARMRSSQTQLTMPDSILGTPEYMSPEQARGDADLDHRTDLYSAGVVLYEMLTGRTPFKAETPTATLRKIIDEEPPDPRKIDKEVDPVLASLALRLMAKRREDRFASAGEAIAALEAGERVASVAGRRRRRRRGVAALVGLAMVAACAWPVVHFYYRTPVVIAVEVDPDLSHVLRVRYSGTSGWERRPFHEFPSGVAVNRNTVEKLDLDGKGGQAVIAGLEKPQNGHNVFAFDARGKELWSLPVANYPGVQQWPDCGSSMHWPCNVIQTGDIDGKPGDELVVAAKNAADYPARISLIDPREGTILSTFWHMGQIQELAIHSGFLADPARPAIIAWGYNNKLDGFDEAQRGDGPRYTDTERGDVVYVMMVLDPFNMDGLGPPRADPRRLPIGPVVPRAYAFLDGPPAMPAARHMPGKETETQPPTLPGALTIRVLDVLPAEAAGAEPVLRVSVGRVGPPASEAHGWILYLGRNLELKHVIVVDGEKVDPTKYYEDYWELRWRPIIQNGEYVEE